MTRIEQIENDKITIDFDERLSKNKLLEILNSDFNLKNKNNPFEITISGKRIKLLVKQITYLGNPHLHFKKRIQISKGWQDELKDKNTYLFGIYKYKNTIIYTYFDKNNFIKRITNNSSAHVSTFDLLKAQELGIFEKKDIRGNIITTIRQNKITEYIENLVNDIPIENKEINLFESFKNTLLQKHHGIDCYKEMIKSNFNNKFQPEWVGFFIEYKFIEFLNSEIENKKICTFESNKGKGLLDFDLNFNNLFLGDLKAHSNNSSAILGNDLKSIEEATKKFNKLWYIVFNHNTVRDIDLNNFEVTNFWNKSQCKTDLMSYSTKMKNNITFTDFNILEINNYNFNYLSIFNQGINSNSKRREPKIKIDKKSINNFLIYNSKF